MMVIIESSLSQQRYEAKPNLAKNCRIDLRTLKNQTDKVKSHCMQTLSHPSAGFKSSSKQLSCILITQQTVKAALFPFLWLPPSTSLFFHFVILNQPHLLIAQMLWYAPLLYLQCYHYSTLIYIICTGSVVLCYIIYLLCIICTHILFRNKERLLASPTHVHHCNQ